MSAAKSDPIDTRLVRRLADILQDTGLTEIEVERGDLRVRVARELTGAPGQAAPATYVAAPAPVAAPAQASEPVAAPAAAAARGDAVKSPMVGTVYLASSPEAANFVQPGDKVTAGQTLLIIEAMKTMNPIPATRAGTVVEVLVENEQPVEFGAPLVIIE
jgi:acetyl-CoA carboxylase biotin carboxyl carrier protein